MDIFPGVIVADLVEAVSLAYRKTDTGGVSPGVAMLFAIADTRRFNSEAEKRIATAVRSEYRGNHGFQSASWAVPVPRLSYDSREVPHLEFEVGQCLVASVQVWLPRGPLNVALIGPLGKPETLSVPMVFLHAVSKQDLARFAIVARSAGHTAWEMPGAKPVKLPNALVAGLSDVLARKPVSAWLEDFGDQGRSVMPLVVGNLLGLEFSGSTEAAPLANQAWTQQQLVDALQGLAYSAKEAREKVSKAAPSLNADLTTEEAIRVILQQAGKGG